MTNLQPEDGLYLTPCLLVLHDGTYDAFDGGAAASPGVEAIAEEGDVSVEQAVVAGRTSGVASAPGGFPGMPVLDPGETARVLLDVDPAMGRYLTFLSMVIPSNDTFLGNDDPLAYEVFDAGGAFREIGPITVVGGQAWNAGTEIDDGQGAAFSTAGGVGSDEGGVVGLVGDLSFLLGTPIAAGGAIGSVPGPQDALASITVAPVPVPASLPLALAALAALGAMGGLGWAGHRRAASTPR